MPPRLGDAGMDMARMAQKIRELESLLSAKEAELRAVRRDAAQATRLAAEFRREASDRSQLPQSESGEHGLFGFLERVEPGLGGRYSGQLEQNGFESVRLLMHASRDDLMQCGFKLGHAVAVYQSLHAADEGVAYKHGTLEQSSGSPSRSSQNTCNKAFGIGEQNTSQLPSSPFVNTEYTPPSVLSRGSSMRHPSAVSPENPFQLPHEYSPEDTAELWRPSHDKFSRFIKRRGLKNHSSEHYRLKTASVTQQTWRAPEIQNTDTGFAW